MSRAPYEHRPDPRYEKVLTGVFSGMKQGPAWTAAGFKSTGKVASVKCSEFLKRPYARKRLAELAAKVLKKTDLTVESVLEEIKCHAFYDITQVLNVDTQGNVTMRDPTSLPEDLKRSIVGIKEVLLDGKKTWELKFADKQKALDSLGRYLQMFKDTVIVENVFRVVQEMGDDELDRRLAELERAYSDAKTLSPPTGEGPPRLH